MRCMLDHLSIQVADFDRAAAFYDAVLDTHRRQADPGRSRAPSGTAPGSRTSGSGPRRRTATSARSATSPSRRRAARRCVAFRDAAAGLGYEVLHEPRVWPEYHPGYFGAFVRDPDGNNVEAVHHTFES